MAHPARISTINRHLRGDIETIALKALEKNRLRRYQSAVELNRDIQHYLDDEPIEARPTRPGVELMLGAEQFRITANAVIRSTLLVRAIAPRKWRLGTLSAAYCEGLWRQYFLPFFIRFRNFGHLSLFHTRYSSDISRPVLHRP